MNDKKLWVGLGIGCGTLVLLGVVGLGAAFFWAKGKVEDVTASATDLGEQLGAQEEALAALNRKFDFTPPEEGAPLALSAERLAAYLAVRQEGLRVFKAFEEKSKAFEAKYEGKDQDLGAIVEAGKLMGELTSRARAGFIASLEQHRMSPREFHAISQAVYATYLAGMNDQVRQMAQASQQLVAQQLEQTRARLREEGLAEAERNALESQLALLEEQAQRADDPAEPAPTEAHRAVHAANAALLDQHKATLEAAINPAFDAFVAGGE